MLPNKQFIGWASYKNFILTYQCSLLSLDGQEVMVSIFYHKPIFILANNVADSVVCGLWTGIFNEAWKAVDSNGVYHPYDVNNFWGFCNGTSAGSYACQRSPTGRSPRPTTTPVPTTPVPVPTDCWNCTQGWAHWWEVGMSAPGDGDRCQCIPLTPQPTPTDCWTCPPGYQHWFDADSGYTSAPNGDKCACVSVRCFTCPPDYQHWYDEGTGYTSAPGGDKCACVLKNPPCFTCPSGYIHWYDEKSGYASAPGGERCACVPDPDTTPCWTCNPGYVKWYEAGYISAPDGDRCACVPQRIFSCFGMTNTNVSVCSGGGICYAENICLCLPGHSGNNCGQFKCYGLDKDHKNVCNSHGTCVGYNTCSCDRGYYGANCNIYACSGHTCNGIAHDSKYVCSSKGNCTAPESCNCQEGYLGQYCQETKQSFLNYDSAPLYLRAGQVLSLNGYFHPNDNLTCYFTIENKKYIGSAKRIDNEHVDVSAPAFDRVSSGMVDCTLYLGTTIVYKMTFINNVITSLSLNLKNFTEAIQKNNTNIPDFKSPPQNLQLVTTSSGGSALLIESQFGGNEVGSRTGFSTKETYNVLDQKLSCDFKINSTTTGNGVVSNVLEAWLLSRESLHCRSTISVDSSNAVYLTITHTNGSFVAVDKSTCRKASSSIVSSRLRLQLMIVSPNSTIKSWSLMSSLSSLDDSSTSCSTRVELDSRFFTYEFFSNSYSMAITQGNSNVTKKSRSLKDQPEDSSSQSSVFLYSMVLDCQDGKCATETTDNNQNTIPTVFIIVIVVIVIAVVVCTTVCIIVVVVMACKSNRALKISNQSVFDPVEDRQSLSNPKLIKRSKYEVSPESPIARGMRNVSESLSRLSPKPGNPKLSDIELDDNEQLNELYARRTAILQSIESNNNINGEEQVQLELDTNINK
ncbi:hypothetical protein AKO1_000241 [Acrasis kona]|uniref:EGF-like domain-containing protein n=1 Tax=Acrasis kona TaxID=1008807 RepID=A0AAW2ZE57_9EUKA